jgi:hypothetical protein
MGSPVAGVIRLNHAATQFQEGIYKEIFLSGQNNGERLEIRVGPPAAPSLVLKHGIFSRVKNFFKGLVACYHSFLIY